MYSVCVVCVVYNTSANIKMYKLFASNTYSAFAEIRRRFFFLNLFLIETRMCTDYYTVCV